MLSVCILSEGNHKTGSITKLLKQNVKGAQTKYHSVDMNVHDNLDLDMS